MTPKEIKMLSFLPSMKGKNVLITGSSSGIGYEGAKGYLYLGAHVIFAVRNREKTKKCFKKLEAELGHPLDAEIALYDQGDLDSIERLVTSLKGKNIDIICLNAGIYFPKKKSYVENTPLTLLVNSVGTYHFLCCCLSIFPKARYILTSSLVASRPKKNDYRPYMEVTSSSRWVDYKISKRTMFAMKELHKDADIAIFHPGVAKTNIINGYAPLLKRAGQAFLTLFTHSAFKGSLGMVYLGSSIYKEEVYLVPRSLFGVMGKPKKKKLPKISKQESDSFLKAYLDTLKRLKK